jgi:hypothetical protein
MEGGFFLDENATQVRAFGLPPNPKLPGRKILSPLNQGFSYFRARS